MFFNYHSSNGFFCDIFSVWGVGEWEGSKGKYIHKNGKTRFVLSLFHNDGFTMMAVFDSFRRVLQIQVSFTIDHKVILYLIVDFLL